jgi:organic radical activating enzyme
MLNVNEIFGPTIQGEGKLVGTPSIFIRFANCNFKCEGYNVEYVTPNGIKKVSCDTYYAVDTAFKKQWLSISSSNIIDEVAKLIPNYKIDIVITGGEPLLYWKNKDFQDLLKYYISNGHKVTIETNASLDIQINETYQKEIIFSMSVKLSNSLEKLEKRVNINTLCEILNKTSESYFKFVVETKFINNTQKEISDILTQVPNCEVYLMPMGDTNVQLNQNSEEVINLAIKNGYKYCDRLHIRVWDNKRGI